MPAAINHCEGANIDASLHMIDVPAVQKHFPCDVPFVIRTGRAVDIELWRVRFLYF